MMMGALFMCARPEVIEVALIASPIPAGNFSY
jgi:hypothetical protein